MIAGVTSLSMYEPVRRRRIFLAIKILKTKRVKDRAGNRGTDVNLQANPLPSVKDRKVLNRKLIFPILG